MYIYIILYLDIIRSTTAVRYIIFLINIYILNRYAACVYIGVICVVKSINPTLYLSIVTAVTGHAAAV